jgi:hypothetical protein
VGDPIFISNDEKNKDEHRIAQEIKETLYHIPKTHGTNH